MTQPVRRLAVVIAICGLTLAAGKSGKKKAAPPPPVPPPARPSPPAPPPARPAAPADPPAADPTPATPAAPLPSDATAAILRLDALQALYELDPSPEQLRAIATAADGMADGGARATVKADEKLAKALAELQAALLDAARSGGGDDDSADERLDQRVTAAHDAVAAAGPPADDPVRPSGPARARAAGLAATFSAAQLAEYVAAHADDIVGPADRLVAAVGDLGDAAPADADAALAWAAADAARLVVGAGDDQAVAARAADWLRANRSAADDTPADRAKLAASARAAVGDVPPATVLAHWFDGQLAELIANPQTPAAVAAWSAARPKG